MKISDRDIEEVLCALGNEVHVVPKCVRLEDVAAMTIPLKHGLIHSISRV